MPAPISTPAMTITIPRLHNGSSEKRPKWFAFFSMPAQNLTSSLGTALGDRSLIAKLISVNPGCVAHRIGRLPDFPPIGYGGRGGTILQWTLAFNSYPHQIALAENREDIFDLLYENSDPTTRLLVCCVLARREEAEKIVREY